MAEADVTRAESTKRHPLDWLQLVLLIVSLAYSVGIQRQRVEYLVEWKTQEIPRVVERLEKRIELMESKEANDGKLELIRQNQLMTQVQIKQLNGWTLLIMKKLNIPVVMVDEDS